MANSIVLIDTSILIDYYRKTDKLNSIWIKLVREGYNFAISSVSRFEIYAGATNAQIDFWRTVFDILLILPFDEAAADRAVAINSELKRKRKQIEIADLFIAATALSNDLMLSTLNKKHFERIDSLELVP